MKEDSSSKNESGETIEKCLVENLEKNTLLTKVSKCKLASTDKFVKKETIPDLKDYKTQSLITQAGGG